MMKKLKMFIPALMVAFSLVAAMTASIAWFSSMVSFQDENPLLGETEGAYFAYGKGTAKEPFGINHPRHLYNLAWLQNLGYINDGTVGAGKNQPTYFELASDVDMSQFSAIPPIGTKEHPFIGYFDGNDKTITGLKVSNNYGDFSTKPTAVTETKFASMQPHIIGMFGVVGTYPDNIKETSSYTQVSAVHDFTIKSATIASKTDTTLIGVLAGYLNGPVSNVGIEASDVDVSSQVTSKFDNSITSNVSDYAVVGYCTDGYKDKVNHSVTTLYQPATPQSGEYIANEDGDNQGWGGSIDMKTMYDGLRTVWDTYSDAAAYHYPSRMTRNYDYDGNQIGKDIIDQDSSTLWSFTPMGTNYQYHYFPATQTNSSGQITSQYTFAHRSNTDRYMYLYGKYKKVVPDGMEITKNHFEEYINGFYITYTANNATHYLSVNNSGTLVDYTSTNTSVPASATTWAYTDNGHLVAYHGSTSQQSSYYLQNNNGSLRVADLSSDVSATVWRSDDSHSYFYSIYNNSAYFITYYSDNWVLRNTNTATNSYVITDGNGNYLSLAYDGSITNQTSEISATKWTLNNNRYYATAGNGSRYSLYYYTSQKLLTTTTGTGTQFTYNNNRLYYRYSSSTSYYICFDRPNWTNYTSAHTTYVTAYYTASNTYAIQIKNSSSFKAFKSETVYEDTSFETQATYFPLRQETIPTGTTTYYTLVYYTYNGVKYYLVYNDEETPGYTTDRDSASYITVTNNRLTSSGKYLKYEDDSVKWGTGTTNAFTYDANSHSAYLYNITDGGWRANPRYTHKYDTLVFNGNDWTVNTTFSQSNYTSSTAPTSSLYTESKGVIDVVPNGIPKDTNTGYVIGGANAANELQGTIRVSQYYGYGSGNYNNLSGLTADGMSIVYTRDDSGKSIVIGDSEEEEFTDYESSKTYNKAKASLERVFALDSSYIYGLHFMSADIEYGDGKSVYAQGAVINGNADNEGNPYDSYELPTNCIDFNLKEKGFINFIAGAYFSGNDSFFSLHEIERNSSRTIVNIREISKIYTDTIQSHSYVYEYADYDNDTKYKQYSVPFKFNDYGTKVTLDNKEYTEYSSSDSNPYSKIAFDCNRITSTEELEANENNSTGYPYYFEIPMNAGEYCLGSVSGGTGAYLMYLDIGANAEKVKRTAIYDVIKFSEQIQSYPKGVFIIAAGVTRSDVNSYCICIGSGYKGKIGLSRTAETVENDVVTKSVGIASQTGGNDSSLITLSYAKPGLVVTRDGNANTAYSLVGSAVETLIERATYIEFHPSNNTTTKLVVTRITIGNSSTTTVEGFIRQGDKWVEKNDLTLYYDSLYATQIDGVWNTNYSGKKVNSEDLDKYFDNLYLDEKHENSFNDYSDDAQSGTIVLQLGVNLSVGGGNIIVVLTPRTIVPNDSLKIHVLDGYDITIYYKDGNGTYTAVTGEAVISILNEEVQVLDEEGKELSVSLKFYIQTLVRDKDWLNDPIPITTVVPTPASQQP